MKKQIAVILILSLLMSLVAFLPLSAQTNTPQADALYAAGLFQGTGTGYDLTGIINRAQGITLALRAQGMETAVKAQTPTQIAITLDRVYDSEKVPVWARPYVAYALNHTPAITTGISTRSDGKVVFAPDQVMGGKEFITFMARAMGYEANSLEIALGLAVSSHLLSEDQVALYASTVSFSRGQAVDVIYTALVNGRLHTGGKLIDALVESGAVTRISAQAFGYGVTTQTQSTTPGAANTALDPTLPLTETEKTIFNKAKNYLVEGQFGNGNNYSKRLAEINSYPVVFSSINSQTQEIETFNKCKGLLKTGNVVVFNASGQMIIFRDEKNAEVATSATSTKKLTTKDWVVLKKLAWSDSKKSVVIVDKNNYRMVDTVNTSTGETKTMYPNFEMIGTPEQVFSQKLWDIYNYGYKVQVPHTEADMGKGGSMDIKKTDVETYIRTGSDANCQSFKVVYYYDENGAKKPGAIVLRKDNPENGFGIEALPLERFFKGIDELNSYSKDDFRINLLNAGIYFFRHTSIVMSH